LGARLFSQGKGKGTDEVRNPKEVDATPEAASGHRRIETLKSHRVLGACFEDAESSGGEGESPTALMRSLEGGKAKRATARRVA
jgi:hypothetical protein